jgi:hypothetical protein
MKRLLSVCLLMLCLTFPVLGGHTMPQGRYCDCVPVQGTCPCCGMILNGFTPESVQDDGASDSQHDSAPNDKAVELGTMIDAFFMWLEVRA